MPLPLHRLPRCLLVEGQIRQHSVHTARRQVDAIRMKGRCVEVPVFERQIRVVVNENDVHVVAHLFDGIVDLNQLLRVRPLTAWHHTKVTHGDRRGHRFRFLHKKFHVFFNLLGWHIFHHFTGAAHDHDLAHVEVVGTAYFMIMSPMSFSVLVERIGAQHAQHVHFRKEVWIFAQS